MRLFILTALALSLTACSSINYNRGFSRGVKDYDRTKNGKLISSYQRGWVSGYSFMQKSDDLKNSLDALKKSLEELERKPLPKSDPEFEKWMNEMLEKKKAQ